MSTVLAPPVALDLPRILTTEGPTTSSTSARPNQSIVSSPHGSRTHERRPSEPFDSRRYAAPPPILPGIQHPHHQLGLTRTPYQPSGPGENPPYGPPPIAALPPGAPPDAYVPPVLIPNKRPMTDDTHPWEPPPKKQSKWTEEEDDQLITLRGEGMKWEEIAKHVPGRSAIACRLHYQNFLERRAAWDEEKKNKLAQLYNRLKGEIWDKIARELHMPWRAVEDMHWRMGRAELAQRAGVREFVATPDPSIPNSTPVTGVPITTSFGPTISYPQQPDYTSSPQTYVPQPPRSTGQPSPVPPHSLPPIAPNPAPTYGPAQQPPTPFADTNRPAPIFGAAPRSPASRSHHSGSSLTNSPRLHSGHRPHRSGSDVSSPRRRALSTSRHATGSMPPIESRSQQTPPPVLPTLKDISGPTSEPQQNMQLPSVRYLQEEVKDSSRLPTPTLSGPSHSNSGPSRPHSRSVGDQRGEIYSNGR